MNINKAISIHVQNAMPGDTLSNKLDNNDMSQD